MGAARDGVAPPAADRRPCGRWSPRSSVSSSPPGSALPATSPSPTRPTARCVGGGAPEVTFPATPTATMAVVDDAGDLASLAVLAVRPATTATRAAAARSCPCRSAPTRRAGSGRAPAAQRDRRPVRGRVARRRGARAARRRHRRDDGRRSRTSCAALLAPIGADRGRPAGGRHDGPTERCCSRPGAQTLDSPTRSPTLLSATDPDLSGADRYPIDVAVWQAIADAVGDGSTTESRRTVGEVPDVEAGARPGARRGRSRCSRCARRRSSASTQPAGRRRRRPRSRRGARDLRSRRSRQGRRTESRVQLPRRQPLLRRAAADGASRLDVAYTATDALLGTESNVVSVDTRRARRRAATVIEVDDESLVPAADDAARACSAPWRCASPTRGSPGSTSSSPSAPTTSPGSTPPRRPRPSRRRRRAVDCRRRDLGGAAG